MTIKKSVTIEQVNKEIESEIYFTALEAARAVAYKKCDSEPSKNLGRLTICVIEMKNGFIVTGESACADPDNFDASIGRKIARENAISKIWALLGYELRSELHYAKKQA